jgi:hypothetical protein
VQPVHSGQPQQAIRRRQSAAGKRAVRSMSRAETPVTAATAADRRQLAKNSRRASFRKEIGFSN